MNGQIAVGWLIVEDLAMVLVLVLLPPLSEWLGGNPVSDMVGASHSLWWSLSIALVKISVFVAFMLIVGRRVFPWLLGYVAETGSRELFSLSVIAAAVGVAYGSAKLFGLSFALGAFFAGMLMRESHLSHRRRARVAAAQGCILGIVLRLGRHAVRPVHSYTLAVTSARRGCHHRLRQIAGFVRAGTRFPLPAEYRAHGVGGVGADRRVFIHINRAGHVAGAAAA